jgi:hypothetical protein
MSSPAQLAAAEADYAEWEKRQNPNLYPYAWRFTDSEGLVWHETTDPLNMDMDTGWDYLPLGHCRLWCQVWCETAFEGLVCLYERMEA